jgi:hypothetical protein
VEDDLLDPSGLVRLDLVTGLTSMPVRVFRASAASAASRHASRST